MTLILEFWAKLSEMALRFFYFPNVSGFLLNFNRNIPDQPPPKESSNSTYNRGKGNELGQTIHGTNSGHSGKYHGLEAVREIKKENSGIHISYFSFRCY